MYSHALRMTHNKKCFIGITKLNSLPEWSYEQMKHLEAAKWQTVFLQSSETIYVTEICYLEMLKTLGKEKISFIHFS